MRITALNQIETDHLKKVVEDMRSMGAPKLRAVETCHGLVAIEGSHRLAAAYELGLDPKITIIEQDEIVEGATLNDIAEDIYASGAWIEASNVTDFTVLGSAIAEFVTDPEGETYDF